MLRGSLSNSLRAPWSFAALLLVTVGTAVLAGCGPHVNGGACEYEREGPATYTVTTIPRPDANGQTACGDVGLTWASGTTLREKPFLYGTPACLAAAGLQVGSRVEMTLQNETSGTCSPQIWTTSDPALNACNSACL
jgi:hypothetical protein